MTNVLVTVRSGRTYMLNERDLFRLPRGIKTGVEVVAGDLLPFYGRVTKVERIEIEERQDG